MNNNEKIINDLRLDRENLLLLISKLQSNWNSLRKWLLHEIKKGNHTRHWEMLDKMNELESKDD